VQGFRAWAGSINPAAAHFIDEIALQTAQRGLEAVSVIVLPASGSARLKTDVVAM
jgi:hypothetical protein